jgi:hypothetical protein
MTLRPFAAILAALGVLAQPACWAQPPAQGSNGASAATPPAYEDRLIEGGALAPDRSAEDFAPYDATGWPRFWRLEGISSYYDQQGKITRENGARLSANLDTPDYGALSLDATARASPGSFIATLTQRDLAFDGNWRANNGLGVLTSLGIDLTRTQYRFYLPTFAIAGATTEWIHDRDLQLQASAGEPGFYDGLRLSGFQALHGSFATVGAQWAFAPRWQAGVQFADARNVDSPFGANGNGRINSTAEYASLAWNGDNTRLQGNLLASSANDTVDSINAVGVWLDGSTNWNGTTHNYGIYRLEPGLTWGYQPVNNDIQGVYYRLAYQTLRWQVDGGIDRVISLSGRGVNGTYATANGHYQATTTLGLGGNGTYLHGGNQDSWTGSAFADYFWSMGSSRVEVSAASNNNIVESRASQVSLSHTWNMPAGSRLSTSVAATRDTSQAATPGSPDAALFDTTFRRLGLGVLGGGDLTNNLSVDANLQYNLLQHGGSASGVYGNAVLNWRIDSRWSVSATYYDNRDDTARLFTLDPLIPIVNAVPVMRNRAILLTLRYEERAGTRMAPLGGRPGGPAGAIAGVLFLDANDNGQRDPGEPGASNVTVLLNGRFSTRTDASGRFEFPFVAAGIQTLTVLPDNLALPWVVGEAKREVDVRTRETAQVEIGARRLR